MALRPTLTSGLPLAPMALAAYLSALDGQALPRWTIMLFASIFCGVLLRVTAGNELAASFTPRTRELVRLATEARHHSSGASTGRARCSAGVGRALIGAHRSPERTEALKWTEGGRERAALRGLRERSQRGVLPAAAGVTSALARRRAAMSDQTGGGNLEVVGDRRTTA